MISSISNTTQIYAPSKVAKTTAISAYSDVSSAKPLGRMEQMQEKYKDVYAPMPSSRSQEREKLQNKLIAERYPDFQEESKKLYNEVTLPNGTTTNMLKENVYMYGSKEAQSEFYNFKSQITDKYPQNMFDFYEFPVSNAKELATFFNAAVYEGLESGKDLEIAYNDAYNSTHESMDTIPLGEQRTMMMYTLGDKIELNREIGKSTSLKYHQKDGLDINLSSYGFSFDSVPTNQYSETSMANYIQNKIKEYEFTLINPSIIESEFQKLNSSYIRDRNSYNTIIKPIEEYKLPNARLALEVYSKYKIFDSIDIKV